MHSAPTGTRPLSALREAPGGRRAGSGCGGRRGPHRLGARGRERGRWGARAGGGAGAGPSPQRRPAGGGSRREPVPLRSLSRGRRRGRGGAARSPQRELPRRTRWLLPQVPPACADRRARRAGGLPPPREGDGSSTTCGGGAAEPDTGPAAVLGCLRERHAALLSTFRPPMELNAAAEHGGRSAVLRRELLTAPPPGGALAQGGDGGAPFPTDPAPPEELPWPRAVSELRGLFQGGGGGVPLPTGTGGPRREPLPKPCMLPVRCVLPPAAATAPGPPEEPGSPLTPPPLLEEEAGSRSPGLRRGPKSHRASEEMAAVPLEEAEHQWLVMAASGQWTQQLHGLLLGDASLAARRDFISGFTALHWAAKNGNCDMVTNIIRAAEKGGARVNVDARSHGGYTALHLAAIHGQEKIINMLVYSYHAKIDLRDYSGKKPHQYLQEGASSAVRRLLGDPSLPNTEPSVPIKKTTKLAASILSSTSTFLGVISDDMAFYDLTKGLRKPSSLNKLLAATTGPRRKPKTRGGFPSYSSLSEVTEEEEEVVVKRRPVSELFFGH
ncbi:ankyrin repeat domain-containing protein SOWAHA [Falco peregrinus]|uniref:ankyrin repeat domain-containing protein SOWAHA n=1 Tax=Falco peregrinus TaxID=8954 RepID=UPI00247AFE87|nr:ankyrin repeat domain-containing protein SOWAHA [Falco peregrinus]